MRVLDLGGHPTTWRLAPIKPLHVTTLNLRAPQADEPWMDMVVGDACNPPSAIADGHYDLVFSNSLLEHVGGHAQRQRMAEVVHRLADRHWVQTPSRYFPIEPHWLMPMMQFLPFGARRWVSLKWPLGHIRTGDVAAAHAMVSEVELIGAAQMRGYFPDSELWRERFLGVTKSLVAIRG